MSEETENVVDQVIAFEPITLEEITVAHSGSIEHEHEHSIGMIPIIIIIGICVWIGSFDTEIRCALGNQKSCASLKAEPPKAAP